MAAVTFAIASGGDGSTVSDDANGTTGLKANGHRTRFVAALVQFVAMCGFAKTQADAAAASSLSAVNAPGTNATSVTSVALPAVGGAFALTVQTGKAWAVGQWVIATATADITKWVTGQIASYSGTALVITARQINGAGTFAAWAIGMSTPLDAALAGRVTTVENDLVALAENRRFYNGDFF